MVNPSSIWSGVLEAFSPEGAFGDGEEQPVATDTSNTERIINLANFI